MTTTETAVQPAAGSHPYPDPSVLPERFYPDITALYERMAATDSAAFDEWEAAARRRVFPQPGRHAARPASRPVPDQGRAVTVPDAPAPPPLPAADAASPLRVHRPGWFAKHGRHAQGPKRDQPPERTEPAWKAPDSAKGTAAPPAAPEQDAPTLKPDELSTEEVRRAVAAADEIQRQSASALERAGATAADLAHLARPGDGRDAAEQVTAVIQRPADQGDPK